MLLPATDGYACPYSAIDGFPNFYLYAGYKMSCGHGTIFSLKHCTCIRAVVITR